MSLTIDMMLNTMMIVFDSATHPFPSPLPILAASSVLPDCLAAVKLTCNASGKLKPYF